MADDKNNPWTVVFEEEIIGHEGVISLATAQKAIPEVVDSLRDKGKLNKQSDRNSHINLLTDAFTRYFKKNYAEVDISKETLNSIFGGDQESYNKVVFTAAKIRDRTEQMKFLIGLFKDKLLLKYKRTPQIWIERVAIYLAQEVHKDVQIYTENLHETERDRPIETSKPEKVDDELKKHFEEMEKESKKSKEEIERDIDESKKEVEETTHSDRKKQVDDQNSKLDQSFKRFEDWAEETRAILGRERGKMKKAFVYMFDTPAEYDKYVQGVKFEGNDPHLLSDRSVFKLDSTSIRLPFQQPAKFIAFTRNKQSIHYAIAFSSDKANIDNTGELIWSKPYSLDIAKKEVKIKSINSRQVSGGDAIILQEDMSKSFILEAETNVPLQQIKSGLYGLRVQLKYNVTQEHGHGFPGYYEYGAPRPNEKHPIFDIDKGKIIFAATYPEWVDYHVFDRYNMLIKGQGIQEITVTVYDKRNPRDFAHDTVRLIVKGQALRNPSVPYTPKTEAEITKEEHEFNKKIVEVASKMPQDIMLLQRYFQQEKDFQASMKKLIEKLVDDIKNGTQWTSKESLGLIRYWLKGFNEEFEKIYEAKKKYIESINKRKEFFTKNGLMDLRKLLWDKRKGLVEEFERMPVKKYIIDRKAFEAEVDNLARFLEYCDKVFTGITVHTENLNTMTERIRADIKQIETKLGVSENDPQKRLERECLTILVNIYNNYIQLTDLEIRLYTADKNLSESLRKLEKNPGIATIVAILAAKGIKAEFFGKDGWTDRVNRVI